MEALAVADRNLQREALSSELSDNTRTAYQKGWSRFTDYCVAEHIADPLSASPGEVARFFVHLATRPSPHSGVIPSMGTVVLYKSAVNKKYLEAGKPSPTNHPVVRSTLKGLARLKGSSSRRVEALREYHIEAMLRSCPNTLIGRRDAAIIAVGFAGALRRSEICNLIVDDVEFLDSRENDEDRMWLTIRQSKTDQTRQRTKGRDLGWKSHSSDRAPSTVAGRLGHRQGAAFPNNEARRTFARKGDAP